MNIGNPSYITFGNYHQSVPQKKEPIEWLVMDGIYYSENKILLLSRYALDCQPFNEELENIGWKDCTLRKWLNNDFLNIAFTEKQQEVIIAGGKPDKKINIRLYESESDEVAEDRIFLLSELEAYLYFQDSPLGRCSATPYALQNGAAAWCSTDGFCRWGVRTRDYFLTVCSISADGLRHSGAGCHVNTKYPIRPAIWISTDAFKKLYPEQNIDDRHPA